MESGEDGGEEVHLSDGKSGGSGADSESSRGGGRVLSGLDGSIFFRRLEDVWWRGRGDCWTGGIG